MPQGELQQFFWVVCLSVVPTTCCRLYKQRYEVIIQWFLPLHKLSNFSHTCNPRLTVPKSTAHCIRLSGNCLLQTPFWKELSPFPTANPSLGYSFSDKIIGETGSASLVALWRSGTFLLRRWNLDANLGPFALSDNHSSLFMISIKTSFEAECFLVFPRKKKSSKILHFRLNLPQSPYGTDYHHVNTTFSKHGLWWTQYLSELFMLDFSTSL